MSVEELKKSIAYYKSEVEYWTLERNTALQALFSTMQEKGSCFDGVILMLENIVEFERELGYAECALENEEYYLEKVAGVSD